MYASRRDLPADRTGISCGWFWILSGRKKAAVIGILPQELAEKTTAAGNTALGGALQYLETPDKKALMEVVAEAGEVSLAEDEAFKERYISYMGF